MNVGDKVLVEATVTQVGEDVIRVSISRDGSPTRVEHVRTVRALVKPARKPKAAAE